MADLPIELADELGERLTHALDVEGKIARALESLGPIGGREVLLLDGAEGTRATQLRDLGARLAFAPTRRDDGSVGFDAPDACADVVISLWSSFRGPAPEELAEARRVLRPGGRLLVVHDYGRDDVSHLRGSRPELGLWSKPRGPFLGEGFKIRVVHCFWTFDSVDAGRAFLTAAFAEAGRAVASALKRPRLSYNIAIYHRTLGEVPETASRAPKPTPSRVGA
jgi:SAM-dependent methyltransferase